jgi:hypothetical protein
MNQQGQPFAGAESIGAFWSDVVGRMMAAGLTPPAPSPDAAAQVRRVLFDTMAEHADRFMRSEAFLSAMKQSMEQSLAWQQMMNQYLQKGLSGMQMPTRADADHIVLLIRGMEERLSARIDDLQQRLHRLEKEAVHKGA